MTKHAIIRMVLRGLLKPLFLCEGTNAGEKPPLPPREGRGEGRQLCWERRLEPPSP